MKDSKPNNVTEEIKIRIDQMIEKRSSELVTLQEKEQQARNKLTAAIEALNKATEKTDLIAFNKAKQEKAEAETEIEMYAARYKQLYSEDFMPEAESDIVIDNLLDYQNILANDYEKEVATTLKTLQQIHLKYLESVRDTEQTITRWTRDIHPNYRRQLYAGDKISKSDKPVPVRIADYPGCSLSQTISSFFRDANIAKLF